ncbi:SDR family oxidoreductase [Autumnicola psychrophila]|uniref:SDR family oxidoreductase n=1 Tax=Autumnicola psychrophila TaxID=3075592 RepID=A0ABU3DNH9_9FLAO|nr:SDR family oxidoreductase [Zunongwangia sp. F225]MDT0685261.1 SDR family oxidoreductase [Zunongwangia sp. F225]
MMYSEIKIGQKAEVTHTLTAKDISNFVQLTGDDNRLHVDAEFAKKTSFKKQVAHGMLGASFISTVIGTKLPGDGALWYSQNLDFLLPVRIGDTITVIAEVIKKNDRDEIIELSTNIFNQNKQQVTKGVAKVKIVQQTQDKEAVTGEDIEETQKVALILGASGGIGFETVKLLLKQNWKVIAHYNSSSEALLKTKNEAPENQLLLLKANLNQDDFGAMFTHFLERYELKIDALVNALSAPIPNIIIEKLEWSDFLRQLDINIKTPLAIIQNCLKRSLFNINASIVMLSSQVVEQPSNNWSHYITAKSALQGFMKSLALDLAVKKIRVNQVSPSLTPTNLVSEIPEKTKLLTAAKTPLKRLAAPNDIAQAIVFLADSLKSGFVTGETIRVNGGQVMW